MTATEELRLPNDTNELDTLLDERGQKHRVWPSGRVVWHDEHTSYEYEPAKNHHDEYWGGILRMTMRHLTPAQAVEAALGRGKCKYESVNQSVNLESGMVYGFEHVLTCGHSFLSARSTHVKYCPECGREVEQ